jgi:putative oxidoreductase
MANSQSADSMSPFGSTMQGIFRIGVALLFMQHGAQKLFGLLGGSQVESFVSLMGLAGVMEFFGGLLVVLGLFTRPVSGILALEMVIAYFMAHAPNGVFPVQDGGGELALLYALGFALIATLGAGKFNLQEQFGD